MSALLDRYARELEAIAPDAIESLLEEVGEKNTVRVVKFAAVRPDPAGRVIRRKVFDEQFASKLLAPALVRLDELRALKGFRPRYLEAALEALGGEFAFGTNLRTNVGIDYAADSLGKSASRPAVAEYIALTENGTAPAAGDTTLTSEITTNGLARAVATYAHTGSATSYTLAKQFTASGTFTTVQKDGIFNAASSGTMFLEATFTAVALISGDQLTVTHTVNI